MKSFEFSKLKKKIVLLYIIITLCSMLMNIIFHYENHFQNILITSFGIVILFLVLYYFNIKFVQKVLINLSKNHHNLETLNLSLNQKNLELLSEKQKVADKDLKIRSIIQKLNDSYKKLRVQHKALHTSEIALRQQSQVLLLEQEKLKDRDKEMMQIINELETTYQKLEVKDSILEAQLTAINYNLYTFKLNQAGKILEANTKILYLLKYESKELIGKYLKDIIASDFIKAFEYINFLKEIKQNKGGSKEIKLTDKQGKKYWFFMSFTPVETSEGKEVIVLANNISKSKRKRLEYNAKMNAIEKFEAVMELDLAGNIIAINQNFCHILGYKEAELVGKNDTILFDEEDKQVAEAINFWQEVVNMSFLDGEVKRVRKDGKYVWLQVSYHVIRDDEGHPYKIFKIAKNVSPQRRKEIELAEQQKILEEMGRTAKVGAWAYDITEKKLQLNDETYKIFGLKPSAKINLRNYQKFFDINSIHQFKKTILDIFRMNASLNTVLKVKNKKREDIYLKVIGNLIKENGISIKIEGIVQDITQEKLAQKEIQKLSLAVENTGDALIIADINGKVEWVNKSFVELSGYSLEEIQGKKPGEVLQGKDTNPETVNLISEKLQQRENIMTEILNYHKSGREYWIRLSITAMYDEEQNHTGFFAFQEDITTIKKVYDELEIAYASIIEANSSLIESISYAQRIQQAILPKTEDIEKILSEYFLIYKPRDIVSGDFYWISEQDNLVTIAVIDCTGHGVPGAFMSMLGYELLRENISHHIVDPSKILLNMHQSIQNIFKQSTGENNGMDMNVCIIDKNTNTLYFAGAQNPLLYIQDHQLNYIKGTKVSIGQKILPNTALPHIFETHTIHIAQKTTIFLYTDGYQDQFGGKTNRKFGSRTFRNLLYQHYQDDMDTQKQVYEKNFVQWKDKSEQIDDITVLGFRWN